MPHSSLSHFKVQTQSNTLTQTPKSLTLNPFGVQQNSPSHPNHSSLTPRRATKLTLTLEIGILIVVTSSLISHYQSELDVATIKLIGLGP